MYALYILRNVNIIGNRFNYSFAQGNIRFAQVPLTGPLVQQKNSITGE